MGIGAASTSSVSDAAFLVRALHPVPVTDEVMRGFWDGVTTVFWDNGEVRWRLPDGRILRQREMEARERAWRAGRAWDADAPDGTLHDTTLALAVIQARLERGLSQRDLAQVAGVSQSMVSRLERGSREPSWRTFRMLVEAMTLEPVVETRPVTAQTTAPSSQPPSSGGP